MELALDPEIYTPILGDNGCYMDLCPSFIKQGIRCPCGSRSDHVFDSKIKFRQHINSVKHKKWLEILNREKNNHYKENIELTDNIKRQREIIGKLQVELTKLETLNIYLESRLFIQNKQTYTSVENLLDLDI
jgi:hypothetical protein|tara:strand:+ start:80 stop:475 length:396 start_codon:yes stop_codon:yes gene_type:complete